MRRTFCKAEFSALVPKSSAEIGRCASVLWLKPSALAANDSSLRGCAKRPRHASPVTGQTSLRLASAFQSPRPLANLVRTTKAPVTTAWSRLRRWRWTRTANQMRKAILSQVVSRNRARHLPVAAARDAQVLSPSYGLKGGGARAAT